MRTLGEDTSVKIVIAFGVAASIAVSGFVALAAQVTSGGTGGGLVFTVECNPGCTPIPWSISWSDNYIGDYDINYFGTGPNDYLIWQQNQGGCNFNGRPGLRPFNSAVAGYVQYHWMGGGVGARINAIDGPALCGNPNDPSWGAGFTSTSVLWFQTDPCCEDFVDIESTWTCGAACSPNTLVEGRNFTWRY
jgi:hypothetical protein